MEEGRMRANAPSLSCAAAAHRGARLLVCLALLGAACVAIGGGCKEQTAAQKTAAKKQADAKAAEEAKKKAEEEKKKKPFDNGRLTPMLSEGLVSTEEGGSLRLAKPGHWTTTVQVMKANHEDFDGRITLAAVDSKNRPLPLPHTSFEMISSRPAVLAKGRPKRVENELLVPPEATKLQVTSELVDRASGAVAEQ